jgi:AcrR family transcriptional regulator
MPKVVDHEKRRQELIATAALVIAERGLERTTLKEVAHAAGFSANLIAHYFDSKNDLLWHVQRFAGKRAAKRFLNSSDHSLQHMIECVLPFTADTEVEWKIRMFFWSRAIYDPNLSGSQDDIMIRVRRDMAKIVREQQQDGRVHPDVDVAITTERLINLANSLSIQVLLEPKKYTRALTRKIIRSALADSVVST